MTEKIERIGDGQQRRFRPYAEYKDSGIKWLGEIPAHWEAKRLKGIASVQLSNVDKRSEAGQVPVRLCNYVDVYYNDSITSEPEFMNATATPDQVRRFVLRVGDVLITKDSESWNDIAVPAVVAEDLTNTLCGYHLAHIKPEPGLDGRFLARQFSASGMRDQFHVAAKGITRFGLAGAAIRSAIFPIAPIKEQSAIADFLDRETAKIDALVAKKQRLIELLQEKRTALITRAVTRGLDPNVPMKETGVEWLENVPEHWEVVPLGRIGRFFKGNGGTKADETEEGVPCVRYGDLYTYHDFHISTTKTSVAPGVAATTYTPIEFGDVLFAGSGETIDEIGKSAANLMAEPACCGGDVIVFRPSGKADARFLGYATDCQPARRQKARMGCGFTVIHIYGSDLKYLAIAIPPLPEQCAIAEFLDRETAKIDAPITRTNQAINYLQEFRNALISAAVTGKIDVREEAVS